jgi:hypothetical protein
VDADRRDLLIQNLAHRLHRWKLGTPAIALLETHKPLSFVASQALLVAQPLLGLAADHAQIEEYVTLLEDDRSVDRLIHRLEELEERGDDA